jgi:ligand-binding sensor domain-containing protein/tRNA A-37 threonylcarbamoyl transferase component Bud32
MKPLAFFGKFPKKHHLLILKIIAIIFFQLFFFMINANPKPIGFQRISLEQGLSQSTVNCIVQDAYGFMWFGTDHGLNRYDGYTIKVYGQEMNPTSGLKGDFINALAVDAAGELWIGTIQALHRYDLKNDSFIVYRDDLPAPFHISGNDISIIFTDLNHQLWAGTNSHGLNRFNPDTKEFQCYSLENGQKNYTVVAMAQIQPQEIWIATADNGLYRYQTATDSLNPVSANLTDKKTGRFFTMRSLCGYADGTLWIGTWQHGLFQYHLQSGQCLPFSLPPGSPTDSPVKDVKALAVDHQQRFWIGTHGQGLWILEAKNNGLFNYRHVSDDSSSLSADHIKSIYADAEGIVWLGTVGGGVCMYSPNRHKFSRQYLLPAPLNRLSLAAVYEDNQEILWIGTSDHGLIRFNPFNQQLIHYTHSPDSAGSLSHNHVKAILKDCFGTIWVGTYGGGLCRMDAKEKEFSCFIHDPGNESGISSNYITHLCEDYQGTLWIGTHNGGHFKGGLNRLNRESMTFDHFQHQEENPNSLSHDGVNIIAEGNPGELWIGTFHGGLNRFLVKENQFSHFLNIPTQTNTLSNNCVTCLYRDFQKNWWIGTLNGLNCLNTEKNELRQIFHHDQSISTMIMGMAKDSQNNLWISTNQGISKLPLTDNDSLTHYDTSDGINNSEFNMSVFCQTKKGMILFGGINGLDAFYGEQINDNPLPPPVLLTEFQIYNQWITPANSSLLSQSIMQSKFLKLPYRANHITFGFVAINFSAPEKNRYAFMMEGSDSEWIYRDSTRRYASYTNLAPGRYTFKVKAANNNGIWNQQGTSLDIFITPPFWQTVWFRLTFIFVFAGLSYLLIGFLKKYLRLIAFWKHKKYLGLYEIEKQIGSGGMGIVYQVHPITDKKKTLAMKILREEFQLDENQRKRFENEARVIDRINHPTIVKVFERGEINRQLYMIMELLDGITLAEKINQGPVQNPDDVWGILSQIAGALAELHQQDILHRDLKPENIMLLHPNLVTVKLLDFGLALHQPSATRLTASGQIIGTLPYMSPELISGHQVTFSTDIYSLGVIIYELLTGKKPFHGNTSIELFRSILGNNPPLIDTLRRDIPCPMNSIIMAMLSKDPINRPTANDIIQTIITLSSV